MTKVLDTLSAIGALVMAAIPLSAIGGFAHAQDMSVTPVHIAVADLDFRSPAAAVVFSQRVDVAADAMCAQAGAQSLSITASCHQAIYDEAVSKLGSVQQQDLKSAMTARSTRWALATR